MITTSVIMGIIGIAISVFLLVLFISAVIYNNRQKRNAIGKDKDEWLFSDFNERLYDILFHDKDEDEIADKLGIDVEKYYTTCNITRTKPEIKKFINTTVYGLGILAVCLIFTFVISPVFLIIGTVVLAYSFLFQQKKLERKADNMRGQISRELPRFLDLLEAELAIGMPIESAIKILCSNMTDTLIAKEFLDAFNAMEIGASDWQGALNKTALRYDVDILTDFVMNISIAYKKGLPIADVVAAKSRDIRNSFILKKKEESATVGNKVLLPVAVFQIIPMLAFLLIPALIGVTTQLR